MMLKPGFKQPAAPELTLPNEGSPAEHVPPHNQHAPAGNTNGLEGPPKGIMVAGGMVSTEWPESIPSLLGDLSPVTEVMCCLYLAETE